MSSGVDSAAGCAADIAWAARDFFWKVLAKCREREEEEKVVRESNLSTCDKAQLEVVVVAAVVVNVIGEVACLEGERGIKREYEMWRC